MIDKLAKSDLKDLLYECSRPDVTDQFEQGTGLFAKSFFPERFEKPFSRAIHWPIFEILNDDSIQKAVIAAPRGVGKTTLSNIVFPARELLFQKRNYVVPVSCTSTAAIEQGENLKEELIKNSDIKNVFGDIKSDFWSRDIWDTINGTRVKPRGAGQQIRGMLYRHHRPDLIIIDDLEDPESMDSEEQRDKKLQWFLADVLNSVNRWKKDWRIVVVGTVLHEDSLLERLLNNSDWESVRLEICDDNFKSNWPEAISDEDIKNLYKSLKEQGKPDVFYREYRNNPIPQGDDAVFSASMFKYYDEVEEQLWKKNIENIVICDPAKTSTVQAADTAIVVWGVDLMNRKFYLRDVLRGRMKVNEIYSNFVDKCIQYNPKVAGVETTGLEEHILYPIKNEMAKKKVNYNLVSLKARRGTAEYAKRGKGKEARVAGLVPFYRNGEVFHNETVSHLIEGQLLSFPKAKKWDVMDCAAYLPIILDEQYSFFYNEDYEEDPAAIEAEYKELEEERMDDFMPQWI